MTVISTMSNLPGIIAKRYLATSIMKTALIILASEGFEEMEAVITGDVLVRGGVNVTYAGINGTEPIKASRGVKIVPDVSLADVKDNSFDLMFLPGGQPGSNILAKDKLVGEIISKQQKSGRLLAAICAAPIAFASHGIAPEKVTSHPSVKKQLEEAGFSYSEDRVVIAGNVVTSRGPGTTFEFALKLVELLEGAEKAQSLVDPMLLKL